MAEIIFEERHGDGRFQVVANDLLAEPVDCIVNAGNGGLSHGGGNAAPHAAAGGPRLQAGGERGIAKVGRVATRRAPHTTARKLTLNGVDHPRGPAPP